MNKSIESEQLPSDLGAQIQRYLDGKISEPEFVELEALLESRAEARTFYRSFANMDANLRGIAEEELGGEGDDDKIVGIRFRQPRKLAVALMQAVATFVLGAAVVYLLSGRGKSDDRVVANPDSPQPTLEVVVKYENSLAILTKAAGVEWSEGAYRYGLGSELPADTLRLEKGVLQLEFVSGAIVIVEGPAEFELVDSMRAVCHFGKTRANVPETAHGFTIASASVDVVDLGTEFAMVVEKGGPGEVHVFDGQVEVHEKPGGEMHNLMSGNGVRFGKGELEFLPLNEMGFADAELVSSMFSAEADAHLARWLTYSEELKSHPDVLLYFSFDEQNNWSRKLHNVRKMPTDPLHGAIVGCSWSEGRWGGKSSLEFKRAGDRVRIRIPGQHDEFSLMAWVRIDGFDRTFNSLMLSDNWLPGGLHWQFSQQGELILGTKTAKAAGHFQSAPVLNQTHLGRWVQLAVSYDAKSKRVAHYLNGEPVWEGEMEQHIPVSVPRGELGNWKTDYGSAGNNIRNLNGRMDEFVVFSRGLSDTEMKDLYERGKPHS